MASITQEERQESEEYPLQSSSTSDAEQGSDEDYSSDTLSCLEERWKTSMWDKTLLSSLNISPLMRSPTEFVKPCDLILEASFCLLSETVLRKKINEVAERVNRLGKEIESYPPEAFSLINTNNVENFTVGSILPSADSWAFSDTLKRSEPEFCRKFSNLSLDFIDHLQNLIRCRHRRRHTADSDDGDQGSRKRGRSQEISELSDVPEEYYQQLFVSFAKMCGAFAFIANEEKQSMQIKGHTVVSVADILLVDFSVPTPKQRLLAVVEVKKPNKEQESGFKKFKRETRRTALDCFTHYLNNEPELVGQHGGELLLFSPFSIFNNNGVVGIIVHGTVVTFSWLKIRQNQYKQMSQRKIPTTAEIKYSRPYDYFTEEGRIEVIKAIFMLSIIGQLKYEFPYDLDMYLSHSCVFIIYLHHVRLSSPGQRLYELLLSLGIHRHHLSSSLTILKILV